VTLLVRWLHLVAAITWIGGMLFIALVLVPVARGIKEPQVRARLVQDAGRRFRTVGWVALGLLFATGLANLWVRPYLLAAPRFHAKLGLVVLALILAALHDFALGPRAGRPGADPSLRVQASWIARINVVVVLVVVLLGLALRG
jgi:putative copper resistance protein D